MNANAFRGSIQNTRLFSIFSSFILCSVIYLFWKTEGGLLLLTLKGYFKLSVIFIQRIVSLINAYSIQYKMLLVRLHVSMET